MSYFVTCTFDLTNASRQDYMDAYADLEALGLKKTVVANEGNEVIAPTTMTMGLIDGESAAAVRDVILKKVRAAFYARGFSSEIFVVVAGNWAWGGHST